MKLTIAAVSILIIGLSLGSSVTASLITRDQDFEWRKGYEQGTADANMREERIATVGGLCVYQSIACKAKK